MEFNYSPGKLAEVKEYEKEIVGFFQFSRKQMSEFGNALEIVPAMQNSWRRVDLELRVNK